MSRKKKHEMDRWLRSDKEEKGRGGKEVTIKWRKDVDKRQNWGQIL